MSLSSPEEPFKDIGKSDQVISMVLISQAQRVALIDYLSKHPYQDVAAGIAFLRDAPSVNFDLNNKNPEAPGKD